MTERRYNDKNGSRNPRNRGVSSKRFDGKTSEQRRNERAQRSHDGMKRGGGGVSKRNKSGHERNPHSAHALQTPRASSHLRFSTR